MAGAADDAAASLDIARGVLDPQSLVPGLSFAALANLAAGRIGEAGQLVDELLAHGALRWPAAHHSAPWFDLSWVLVDLERVGGMLTAIDRVERRTRWVEAAEATARGDYVVAARLYAAAGNPPAEAYTRLRAAQAGLPGAGLDKAIAFFRQVGATAYLAQAEELAAASA